MIPSAGGAPSSRSIISFCSPVSSSSLTNLGNGLLIFHFLQLLYGIHHFAYPRQTAATNAQGTCATADGYGRCRSGRRLPFADDFVQIPVRFERRFQTACITRGQRFANGRVFLECSGADLLDGTPVVDVKPYIPFVEARPDAAAGFAAEAPPQLRVEWQPESGADRLEESFRLLVEQSIAQDPRPAYQDTPGREYAMAVGGADVRFLIEEGCARIIAVSGSLKDANGSK
ncbi:hypothetical protein NEIELOOT_02360 [Neisseria elongata subsp. glycolytica ATCC 29315]|uniref:Methyltransferase, YaeB family n=1 Tax=Neisseria elongata subsp. glycolytica ATCC 29315 TaxID=546263 RepID=D4DTF5_NEIEG|nr:hypothetical protein NEIELOOT_02360 [Neisseria elongata subsp. glycolytica ATCC 29315]